MKRLGSIYQLFVQSLGISATTFSFLDLREEQMDARGAKALPRISRSVEFDSATFMYEDGELPTLKDIDLKVPAGRRGGDRRLEWSGKDDTGQFASALLLAYDGRRARLTV